MKAYVSLHTDRPQSQLDAEVSYKGYRRLFVEYDEDQFGEKCINAVFPIIEESSPDIVTYVALGACESGQGEIFMCVPILPHIALLDYPERRTAAFWISHGASPEAAADLAATKGHTQPEVSIGNTDPVRLPDNLNPIARIAHKLVMNGLMHPAEIHPKLFEAINDALQNAGVPVLQVIRSGAAEMKYKLGDLDLRSFGNA